MIGKMFAILSPVALLVIVLANWWMISEDSWDTLIRGTSGADTLQGGSGDEIIQDSYTPDAALDVLYGEGGDDLLDTVSDPPSKDIVHCGSGYDKVQADPRDDIGDDCEKVRIMDVTKTPSGDPVPTPPAGEPKYILPPGESENKNVQTIDLTTK